MTTKSTDVLNSYLDAIVRCDTNACLDLFAEQAVVNMPLLPEGMPSRIVGKENFAPLFGALFGKIASLEWVRRDVNATDDPQVAVARSESNAVLKSGKPYSNTYAIFVRVVDGKIVETNEYFSAEKAAAIFAH